MRLDIPQKNNQVNESFASGLNYEEEIISIKDESSGNENEPGNASFQYVCSEKVDLNHLKMVDISQEQEIKFKFPLNQSVDSQ